MRLWPKSVSGESGAYLIVAEVPQTALLTFPSSYLYEQRFSVLLLHLDYANDDS